MSARSQRTTTEQASKPKRRVESAPSTPDTSPEVQLHRVLGNRAYGRLAQAKLTVGAPDDPYEREADRVADRVMRTAGPVGQHACACGGSCTACQEGGSREDVGPEPPPVAQAISPVPPLPPDDDAVQPDGEVPPPDGPSPHWEDSLRAVRKESGQPLSPPLRAFYESRFGADFGDVRLHTGGAASQAARAIGARAFTAGSDIAFRSGAFRPETQEGRRLLAHELTHVVQQTGSGPNTAPGAQRQPQAEAETAQAVPVASPLIVDGGDAALEPGQMRKAEFLEQARAEACLAADEVLARVGRSTDGCPYLGYWYTYYLGRDSRHLERALRLYVPEAASVESAAAYIPLLVARLRQGVERWAATGELSGVPQGVPVDLPTAEGQPATQPEGTPSAEEPQLKTQEGGTRRAGDPAGLRAELGEGQPFGGSARSRMESAFGTSFSGVRVHTDGVATSASERLNARAFTVGRHVAFGAGEYRPGTPVGDALLAHELAHVVQQRQADSAGVRKKEGEGAYGQLEEDADRSAVGAVVELWAGIKERSRDIAENAMPRLKSGLRLQRCDDDEVRVVTPPEPAPPPEPAEPEVDPRDAMEAFLRPLLSDNEIAAAEWARIGERARELELSDTDLESVLGFDMDFDMPHDEIAAILAISENPVIRRLASGYTTALTAAPRTLVTDPLPLLMNQVFADARISREELEALKVFNWNYEADVMEAAFTAQNVGEPTRSSLLALMGLGFSSYRAVASRPGLFPIRLAAEEGGPLQATTDLRQPILAGLTDNNEWSHSQLAVVRGMVVGMGRDGASTFLQGAGFEAASAALIARELTRPQAEYEHWVTERADLRLSFTRRGDRWALTTASRTNLALPWHPSLVRPLAPVAGERGGERERAEPSASETIASYAFASGRTERADRLTYQFLGHTFSMILAEALYEDETLFDRVEEALSVIPTLHVPYLRTLVLDPGSPPGATTADASREGQVNMYFRGAGPRVPQASLNETTAHEYGHLVSFQAAEADPRFWEAWERAMSEDGIGVSRYGLTNEKEDFAEAYVLYLSGGRTDAEVRRRYSRRFTILDGLF